MQSVSDISRQRSIALRYAGYADADPRLVYALHKVHSARPGTHLKPARYDELIDVLGSFRASALIPYFTEYIHDPDGSLVKVNASFSRSFVQNSLGCLQVRMDQGTAVSMTDTGGTPRSVSAAANTNDLKVNAPAATTGYGIQWGTGTNAEAVTDTKLQTLIAHGSGAGQLSYGSCTVGNYTPGAGVTTLTVTRSGSQGSGGVTVEERGLSCLNGGGSAWQFCIIRDVAQVAVSAGQTLTTVYTYSAAL
jgi:hypothetical protein